ncbi:hypothetical protein [Cytobacillus purgationiresistens]|uniref:Uncharacterized protein n=1 Tax=Cytobacillus purgationiresistens TaxID=863449 RepID=A0ABU0ARM3_9BACI|nr:hypothetical protein [Cytobacillus purgationiresistens]MDQ0273909.1 hypothetical protein [Cytobacillus purgationiresistens]
MKNYVVFIISFSLLYLAVNILSGWFLTAFYTPNLSLVNNNVSQEVVFGQAKTIPFIIILLVASIAYYFSRKIFTSNSKKFI